ncbi:hypothetical protein TRFO_37397 [Tritrichomonas foetus]|uniref:Uncharacterized protein n=1 Tax=Tritrichomonas foetus TaxID=1144522 RepID=A0A1J4JG68_9EUKA|nr:hypothetical protein TRFO_37397 [Tritrichomonas foetus]|eukprot:OHS96445.1 hypothetical protein TRFO_37397 [Tritrichomonas foetus]
MFLTFFTVFIYSKYSPQNRTFPYYPIIFDDGHHKQILNYFDLKHLDDKDPITKHIRKVVKSLKMFRNINHNIEILEEILDNRNGDAAFILGIINEYGLFGKPVDNSAARKYYERGAKLMCSECQASLAYFYRYGIGGQFDEEKALELTKLSSHRSVFSAMNLANNKNPNGYSILRNLANIVLQNLNYFECFGRKIKNIRNLPEDRMKRSISSIEYYRAASRNGYSNATMITIMKLLQKGNFEAAKEEIELNINDFDKTGMSAFLYSWRGMMKKYGLGYEKNITGAEKDLEMGASLGCPIAFTEISKENFIDNLDGSKRAIAKKLLELGITVNDTYSLHEYGLQCLKGISPFEKNISAAELYFERALGTHKNYLPSLYFLSRIKKTMDDFKEAHNYLNLLLESSFIFQDQSTAFDAAVDGDYEYSILLYNHLLDASGSKNIFKNLCKLNSYINADPLWLLKENYDNHNRNGNHNNLKNFYFYDEDIAPQFWGESRDLKRTTSIFFNLMNDSSKPLFTVFYSKALIFILNLTPYLHHIINGTSIDQKLNVFMIDIFRQILFSILFVVLLVLIYILIGAKIKLSFKNQS